jgi:hypothetical protein
MRSGPAAHALDDGPRLWPAWRPSLPRTIAAATALAIAIVVALFSYIAWRDRQQTLHETEVVGRNLAAVLAEHANRLFETTNFVMREAIRLAGPDGPIRATGRHTRRCSAWQAPHLTSSRSGSATRRAMPSSPRAPTPPRR